jgi:hypothetical protein
MLPDNRIRTVCEKCGLEIIGHVSQALAEAEMDHRARCPKS